MNDYQGTSTVWAIVVIVVVPIAVIAAAELDERLRQRDSPLRSAAGVLRTWGLPFFAIWALLAPVLGVDEDGLAVRAAATGLVLSIAAALSRAVNVGIDATRERSHLPGRRGVPELLLLLPRLAVVLVSGWILIESVWGVDLSAALTALGVTSLIISFALQDTLSGLASGMLLLSDQPIQPGHWIKIGDTEGQVVDINWRTTRIRNRDGDVIIVPNSELAQSSIKNFTDENPLHRVVVPVQVAFVNPPTLAKAMLLDAARSVDGVVADPPPQAVVTQIDDPLMGYDVHMWVEDYAIVPRVENEFGTLVWYQSHRHDVPLPSPAQDLFLHDAAALAAAAGVPQADLRRMLAESPLLASLDDGDLDRLSQAASTARFAVGEIIGPSSVEQTDLFVLSGGTANLVLRGGDGPEVVLGDVTEGEIARLPREEGLGERELGVRAVTDCEVVVVDGAVVEEIASRSVELAAAFNRIGSVRRRRAERVVVAGARLADDETAEEIEGSSDGGADTAGDADGAAE